MSNLNKGQDTITTFILIFFALSTLVVIAMAFGFSLTFLIQYLADIIFALIVIAVGTFLVLFGIMFAAKNPRVGRFLAYFGVAVFIIGFFIAEMAYIVKIKDSLATPLAVKCGGSSSGGSGLFGNVDDVQQFVSCIITGYKYKGEYSAWAVFGFWVFGVLIPLLLLMFLFYDFVDASGVVKKPMSKKVVGYSLGVLAFRGFIVANLIELLSIGSVGIALLAIDLIFAGGLLAYVNRVFEQWRPIEEALGLIRVDSMIKKRLIEHLRVALRACSERQKDNAINAIREADRIIVGRPDYEGQFRRAIMALSRDPSDFDSATRIIERLIERIQNG